jgi:hypothetical protein
MWLTKKIHGGNYIKLKVLMNICCCWFIIMRTLATCLSENNLSIVFEANFTWFQVPMVYLVSI